MRRRVNLDAARRGCLGAYVSDWQDLLSEASRLRRDGHVGEAIAAYRKLLELNPNLPDSWYNLGWLQRQSRQFEDALESYAEALNRSVNSPEQVHLNRAVILADHLARPDEAEAELRAALAIDPRYVPALLNLGNIAEDLGRRDDARDAYAAALDVEPANMLALSRLAGVMTPAGPDEPLIAKLEHALAQAGLGSGDRADLGFALGRLLDAVGLYDDAFAAYAAANQASRASAGRGFQPYDPAAAEAFVDRLIAAFPAPAVQLAEAQGPAPLFICGMFRSGSTLAEQILASHSRVRSGGELDILPELIAARLQPYPEAAADIGRASAASLRRSYLRELPHRGLGEGLVTDKRPDNFLHIGLIKTMFPEAKIVHTRRQALDNALSLYFLHLDPDMAYALDLSDIAHWYGQYRRLMDHWRGLYGADIFGLDYDTLVADPRPTLGALFDFCGLEWEDACMEFHASANAVKTASVWQVRQPLHGASSGRWRNYARYVEPLQEALQGFD